MNCLVKNILRWTADYEIESKIFFNMMNKNLYLIDYFLTKMIMLDYELAW